MPLPKPDINQQLLIQHLQGNPHFRAMLADFGDAVGAALSFDASSSKQDLMQALCDSRELLNEFLRLFSATSEQLPCTCDANVESMRSCPRHKTAVYTRG